MGTWAAGPFDNDTAADWCGTLQNAAPAEREHLIRAALDGAADETAYLDQDVACEAIAAAAVIASQRPGGSPLVQTSYAPAFLAAGGTIDLPQDTLNVALRALERVAGEESEWRELWDEAGLGAEALRELETLRVLLT